MSGPTAWPQQLTVVNVSTQTITTTTETVIATLAGVNSRAAGSTVTLSGAAVFAVNASTTATLLRIRIGSVTGTLLGVAQSIGAAAGDTTGNDSTVAAQYTPSGEMAGGTFVLTIQATAAAANWNVTLAMLSTFQ